MCYSVKGYFMALIKGLSGSSQARNSILNSLKNGVPVNMTPTNGKKSEQRRQASDPYGVYSNMPSPKDWRH